MRRELILHVLGRMDDEYEDQFQHLNFSFKPREYWRRQGYTTFQHETTLADAAHLVGEDNIIWGWTTRTRMVSGRTRSR